MTAVSQSLMLTENTQERSWDSEIDPAGNGGFLFAFFQKGGGVLFPEEEPKRELLSLSLGNLEVKVLTKTARRT